MYDALSHLDNMCTCMSKWPAYQPPEGVHEGQLLPLGALIEGNSSLLVMM